MMGMKQAAAPPSLETDKDRRGDGKDSQQIPRLINHSRLGCVMLNKGGIVFAQCSNNELLFI